MPMMNPSHPGLSVRHDCLKPLNLSVTEAARKLGISRKQLSDIVNCRSGISPGMAIVSIRRSVVALILGTGFKPLTIWRRR